MEIVAAKVNTNPARETFQFNDNHNIHQSRCFSFEASQSSDKVS